MVGPWILFAPSEIDVTSDLQFIQDRVDAGEWLEAHGAINAVTNKITIIPASGKTLYLFKAKISISTHVNPATRAGTSVGTTVVNDQVKAALKIDGTIKDTTNIGIATRAQIATASGVVASTNAIGNIGDGRLDALGLSLVGDGVKEVAVENILDDGSADATLSGWIKTT